MANVTRWVRFRHDAEIGYGQLTSSGIAVHAGEMFGDTRPTGQTLTLDEVELLAPAQPSKVIALWNNFHALAAKLKSPEPPEPLYLLKAVTSVDRKSVV